MLEIQEKNSTDGYEEIVKSCGDEKLHITEALDRGEVIGYSAYSYGKDKTIIYGYDHRGDLLLCDGLVRSVLFKSCLKGINKAVFMLSDNEMYKPLQKLGFLTENSNTAENIDSFMNGCQNCRQAEK